MDRPNVSIKLDENDTPRSLREQLSILPRHQQIVRVKANDSEIFVK